MNKEIWKIAFNEGYNTKTIYDNPYWKNYPKNDCSEEEQSMARAFVDGYAQKAIDENYGNSNS